MPNVLTDADVSLTNKRIITEKFMLVRRYTEEKEQLVTEMRATLHFYQRRTNELKDEIINCGHILDAGEFPFGNGKHLHLMRKITWLMKDYVIITNTCTLCYMNKEVLLLK